MCGKKTSLALANSLLLGNSFATFGQAFRDGISRSLANLSASSSFEVTHMQGPGSSDISQHKLAIIVSVFAD
jgi:hypothetical protein